MPSWFYVYYLWTKVHLVRYQYYEGDIAVCNTILQYDILLHFEDIRGLFLCPVTSGFLVDSGTVEWCSHLRCYIKLWNFVIVWLELDTFRFMSYPHGLLTLTLVRESNSPLPDSPIRSQSDASLSVTTLNLVLAAEIYVQSDRAVFSLIISQFVCGIQYHGGQIQVSVSCTCSSRQRPVQWLLVTVWGIRFWTIIRTVLCTTVVHNQMSSSYGCARPAVLDLVLGIIAFAACFCKGGHFFGFGVIFWCIFFWFCHAWLSLMNGPVNFLERFVSIMCRTVL